MERIGVIPAAGFASRISPLPCSKEIYPVGFQNEEGPRAACHALLESMAAADADKAYVILRSGKWDIPAYLGSGAFVGLNLAYIVTDQTAGTPFTVDRAFLFVDNAIVLFGFPDIIFEPKDAFVRLLKRQQDSGAGIVVGLYRAKCPDKMDMVELDSAGRLREIVIKPCSTQLEYTWIIAVWTSAFTRFMHEYLSAAPVVKREAREEIYVGDVFRAWIREGFTVETVTFSDGNYVDIGTPEDLISAVRGMPNH